ncbi:MAG: hypothetical protein K2M94_02605 [Paramuribaculum sp.]|nr:hypothetical protein [Paramuribaculum sp.]
MKLINKIFLGTVALSLMAGFQSCNDDDETTLEGAKTVYIEITPSELQLSPGDQMALSARVTNGSGDVIDTPVTWSVVDETVAEIIPVYEQITEEVPVTPAEGEEGDENGEENSTESKAEGDTDPVEGDDEPETITVTRDGDFLYFAVRALKGSQGKQTLVRATLEDGRYAVAPLNVIAGSIEGALTMLTTGRRSYTDDGFDTVWVKVNPITLLEDCQLSYSVEFENVYAEDKSDMGGEFQFIPGSDIVYGRDYYNKPPYATDDKDARTEMLDWVGVVYRAPRMVGNAVFTVTLSDGESSESVDTKILVAPKISPGFEVNGVRPGPQEENPSNIKHTLINVVMDVNSSYKVGACLGVQGQCHAVDIDNALACETNGLFKWDVTGSGVLVKGMEFDMDYPEGAPYPGGYVSYLVVESGIREGTSTITYTLPDKVMTCNIKVENFAVSHPVERVIFRELSVDMGDGEMQLGKEVDERTFIIGDRADATLEVLVAPDVANEYHKVEVTSSDPSVISVDPVGQDAGYNRTFTANKPGTAVITGTALDKSKTFIATVIDKVTKVELTGVPTKLMKGDVVEIEAKVTMVSGKPDWIPQCVFTVSDPAVAAIENIPGAPNKVKFTALAEGEVELSVNCDGLTAGPVTISIMDSSDAEINNDNISDAIVVFDPDTDGNFFLGVSSPEHEGESDLLMFYVDLYREELDGECVFEDATVQYKGATYDGSNINLTLAIDPDDEECVLINGTITLPNGTVLTINLRANLEQ